MQIIVFLIHVSCLISTRNKDKHHMQNLRPCALCCFRAVPLSSLFLSFNHSHFNTKNTKKLVPNRPASSDELACKLLKLCSGQALFNVLGTRGISRDERQRDLGLQSRSDSIYTIYTLSIEQIGFLLVSLQFLLIVSDITDPKYMWRYVNHESSWPLARLKAPS